jgi:hypothetical protein
MNHSFNVEDAEKYGIVEAILLSNLTHWMLKNKANNKHFYDGRWWTYNSVKAFSELFPYLTKDKVRRALDSLRDAGAIKVGSYNQSAYDRTSWYSVTSIGDSTQIDLANKTTSFGKFANSEAYINTDVNTDIKGEDGFALFWLTYPNTERKGSRGKCQEVWVKKKLHLEKQKIVDHVESMKSSKSWTDSDGKFVPAPLVYLNQQRWDGVEMESTPKIADWMRAAI